MRLALLVLVTSFEFLGRPVGEPPCQAKLRLRQEAHLLTLTGYCHSLLDQPAHYRYQLAVWRRGTSGQSHNAQGGEFALGGQQEATLSTVQLNVAATDSYQAKLLVFDASGHVVAQDSASQAGSAR
jgi:hypothetical protein